MQDSSRRLQASQGSVDPLVEVVGRCSGLMQRTLRLLHLSHGRCAPEELVLGEVDMEYTGHEGEMVEKGDWGNDALVWDWARSLSSAGSVILAMSLSIAPA